MKIEAVFKSIIRSICFRGKYGGWSVEDMERALVAVRKGEVGLNEASRTYGIPKATLKRRLDGGNKHAKESKKLSGHPTYLPE